MLILLNNLCLGKHTLVIRIVLLKLNKLEVTFAVNKWAVDIFPDKRKRNNFKKQIKEFKQT